MAVADFDAAVADWSERLGWPVSAASAESATFALEDSYVELVEAGEGSTGVTLVSVVVDSVDEAVDRLTARGASFIVGPEGYVRIDPAAVNGVPIELRPEAADTGERGPSPGGRRRPLSPVQSHHCRGRG